MKKQAKIFLGFLLLSVGLVFASGVALDGIMMNQTNYHFINSSLVIDKTIKAGGNIREVELEGDVRLDSYKNRDGLVTYTLKKNVTFAFQGSKVLESKHLVYLSQDAFKPLEP